MRRRWRTIANAALWDLFVEVAERQPAKTAIVAQGEKVSYAELAADAGRVAGGIARALAADRKPSDAGPLSPGFPVALCVSRSPAMIAGMLGILRAGGAYVPVPPTYPEERIRLMLADSGAVAVVTDVAGLQSFGLPVLDLNALVASEDLDRSAPPCARADGESPAYIIYTSGSTGTPKRYGGSASGGP